MKRLDVLNKYKHILLVSCDAGGANLLNSIIQLGELENRFRLYVDGPADTILGQQFPTLKINDLYKEICNFDLVLTGTSGESKIEKNAINLAKQNNIYTISYLDHWINFEKRFQDFPNEIWITHSSFEEKINRTDVKLTNVGNSYFEDISHQYQDIKEKITSKENILFIGEYFKGKDQFQTLNDLDYLRSILIEMNKNQSKFKKFVIRPHPSDENNKYDAITKEYLFVQVSTEKNILEDLLSAKVVIGKTSMGLNIASMLGFKTISFDDKRFNYVDLIYPVIKINQVKEFSSLLD